MPYPGEHAARIRDPDQYPKDGIRRQNNKFGRGIDVIFGIRADGKSEVQAIRFDSTLFTVADAKKWLQDHDYHPILFEPATGTAGKEQAAAEGEMDTELKQRALAVEINPTLGNMQELDGGLLVKGVKLLAAGTWTDSVQKTACRYTPAKLKEFAQNWTDKSLWSRHGGGVPRDITEKIGDIRNIRYQEEAVVGDPFFHGRTSRSKDTMEMVKHSLAGFVSVEIATRDRWIPAEKLLEADVIRFDGAATVNRGACNVCTLRSNEKTPEEAPKETPAKKPVEILLKKESERMDDAEKKALEDRFKALEEGFTKQVDALKADSAAKGKELEQTKAELEKLKKEPAPPATKTEVPGKALEAVPEYAVKVDRTAGTVG
jgi:hypothetical protein